MRFATVCLLVAVGSGLSIGQPLPVTVFVTAPHAGMVARISGPAVTLRDGAPLRSGSGFVIVATPAEVLIDPDRGDHFFQLDPDTAWVSLEVQAGGNSIHASARNIIVTRRGTELYVAGVPPSRPGTR